VVTNLDGHALRDGDRCASHQLAELIDQKRDVLLRMQLGRRSQV
jgi:hypothetical protein